MTFAISSSDSSWNSKGQFIPSALQLSRFFIAFPLFDGHLPGLFPGLFGSGDPDFENPVPELRPGLLRLHVRRKGNGTREGSVRPFHPVIILLLDLFLLFLLPGDCERVFGQVRLDLLLLQAGQLHLHDDIVPFPEHVHGRDDLLHFGGSKPRPPRRAEKGEGPPEEILEAPFELLPGEKRSCGLRLRQFLRSRLRHETPPARKKYWSGPPPFRARRKKPTRSSASRSRIFRDNLPARARLPGRSIRPMRIRSSRSSPPPVGWLERCRLSPSLRCGFRVSSRSLEPG